LQKLRNEVAEVRKIVAKLSSEGDRGMTLEKIVRAEIKRRLREAKKMGLVSEAKGPLGRPRIGTRPAILVSWERGPQNLSGDRDMIVTFTIGGVERFKTVVESSKYEDPDPAKEIAIALERSPIEKGSYTLSQLGNNWILSRISPDSTVKKGQSGAEDRHPTEATVGRSHPPEKLAY
jgi:hypothetical protein